MSAKPVIHCSRTAYRMAIELSLRQAQLALRNAGLAGWRQDCLRVAVRELQGALRNVEDEDANGAQLALASPVPSKRARIEWARETPKMLRAGKAARR